MITIRNEEEKDRAEVEDVIRKAFWNLYVPGCNEHYLAHIMRSHPDFLPELDFVIELDGKIIGSIMYTRNKLIEENGNEKTFSLSDRYAFCPNINAGATANSCWNIHLNVPRRQAMTSSSFSAARTTTSAGASKAAKNSTSAQKTELFRRQC